MNVWLYYNTRDWPYRRGLRLLADKPVQPPRQLGTARAHGLFTWLVPHDGSRGVMWNTVWILLTLAVAGEIVEFLAGGTGAANRGASRRSIWLSLIGALVGSVGGAIVGLPIALVGSPIAALLGGAVGAFVPRILEKLGLSVIMAIASKWLRVRSSAASGARLVNSQSAPSCLESWRWMRCLFASAS
jgi:hypothetical protein